MLTSLVLFLWFQDQEHIATLSLRVEFIVSYNIAHYEEVGVTGY